MLTVYTLTNISPDTAATSEIIRLVRGVLNGLAYAHSRGVLHRDLKPNNVMVNQDREPRILDFGLTAAVGQTDGFAGGSPPYMPPELLVDGATAALASGDVYAVGIMLYVLLSGEYPFSIGGKMSSADIAETIIDSEPNLLRSVRRHTHRDLDAVVMKAIAKDPAQRYQTADAFGADLDRYVAGNPVDARKLTAGYYVRNRVAKYKAATIAGLLLTATVIGLLVNAYLIAEREAEAQRRANYVTSVNLAASEIRDGNTAQAAYLLDACPQYLRNWEWQRLSYVLGHGDAGALAKIDTASLFASNAVSVVVATKTDIDFGFNPIKVAFDLLSKRTAASYVNKIVVALEDGEQIELPSRGPMAWTEDGRLLAADRDDDGYYLVVWSADLKTKKRVHATSERIDHVITANNSIALGFKDGIITTLDARSFEVDSKGFRTGQFTALAFNPTGTRLVTVGKMISIWDPASGAPVLNVAKNADASIAAAFSEDGSTLYVVDARGPIRAYKTDD